MTNNQKLVSVILPVYNQADHIAEIVDDYVQVLAKLPYPYELLLVVNGSRDKSLEVCQALAEKSPQLKVVHSIKGGWGLGVKLGLEHAQGDLLCYTNSARTSPNDLLLCLLYDLAYSGMVIKANRKFRDNWLRRLGSLIFNLQCRALFDLSNWDINGTPKVFPRQFEKLLKLTHSDDLIDAEFCAICRDENYPMLEAPIFSIKRHGGKSTTSILSAAKLYIGAYKLWQERQRAAKGKMLQHETRRY